MGDHSYRLGRAAIRRDHGLRRPLQVPHELVEAAQIDGARTWRILKDVTLPVVKPVAADPDQSFDHLGTLASSLRPYLLIGPGQQTPNNYLMSIYLYVEGYGQPTSAVVPRSPS